MSKVAIQGNASGTGTFTIAAPNSNTDRTLTLPDEAGTVLTSASSIVGSQLPTGSVLQVVSTIKTSTFTETVSSGQFSSDVTGLTATITPSSSSSKILLLATVFGFNTDNEAGFVLVRNVPSSGTFIARGDTDGSRARVTGAANHDPNQANPCSFSVLDEPSTTSAITYSVRIYNLSSVSRLVGINRGQTNTDSYQFMRTVSTITAMEIAG